MNNDLSLRILNLIANVKFLLSCLILFTFSCNNENSEKPLENILEVVNEHEYVKQDSVKETSPTVKNSVTEEYVITFAEWYDKSTNVTCIVIREDSLFTIINDGSLNGNKNEVIESGILRIHEKTGQTILTKDPNDIYAPEIGGCSDGPIVVDLENKVIEFC